MSAAGSLRERFATGWKSSKSFFFGVVTGPIFGGVFYLLGSASGARRRDDRQDVKKQETAAYEQEAAVGIKDRMEQWDQTLVKDVAEIRNLLLRIEHQLSSYEGRRCCEEGDKQELGKKSMDG